MTTDIKVSFTKLSLPENGTLVLFAAEGGVLGREMTALIGKEAHEAAKAAKYHHVGPAAAVRPIAGRVGGVRGKATRHAGTGPDHRPEQDTSSSRAPARLAARIDRARLAHGGGPQALS